MYERRYGIMKKLVDMTQLKTPGKSGIMDALKLLGDQEIIQMKYVRQFLIILLVTFLGEACRYLLPLPVPASIYGLLLLLAALLAGIIKHEQVKEVSRFLIEVMPLMFIPASVGLLESWGALQGILAEVLAITAVSTVLVMGVSGVVTQRIIRRRGGKERERDAV